VPANLRLPKSLQRRVVREDGRSFVQVDPTTYQGDWKADETKLKDFAAQANKFRRIAKRMVSRKDSTKFVQDPDIRNDVNTAVSIYNKLLGGGVLDRNEFDRYSEVFADPDTWMWGTGAFTSRESRARVWKQAMELMDDMVRNQALIMANNGVVLSELSALDDKARGKTKESAPDT